MEKDQDYQRLLEELTKLESEKEKELVQRLSQNDIPLELQLKWNELMTIRDKKIQLIINNISELEKRTQARIKEIEKKDNEVN